jgi:hypothetical protein
MFHYISLKKYLVKMYQVFKVKVLSVNEIDILCNSLYNFFYTISWFFLKRVSFGLRVKLYAILNGYGKKCTRYAP